MFAKHSILTVYNIYNLLSMFQYFVWGGPSPLKVKYIFERKKCGTTANTNHVRLYGSHDRES